MADVVDARTRSRMMSGIRGKNTKPEWQVRRYLHAAGFRYALHRRDLPGRPDLVLPRYRAVVLVHGCFWHGHAGCPYAVVPATRREFWVDKLSANRMRDARAVEQLRQNGWRVAVVWECALRKHAPESLEKLAGFLKSDRRHEELSWSQAPSTE